MGVVAVGGAFATRGGLGTAGATETRGGTAVGAVAHTHIIVRGVLDDGRIFNIAGDYIAHGIRHRASELVTLELGHQSEIELQTKLRSEVEAERWTRHDKMLQTEQREQGIIDLRPGEGATYLVHENRGLMIGRVKHLERYGLANEVEPGRWGVSDRAEGSLTELSERNDVIKTVIRRALGRWANV